MPKKNLTIKNNLSPHFCHKCQYEEKKESEDPCYDCLGQGYNVDSHKPINFKEKINE